VTDFVINKITEVLDIDFWNWLLSILSILFTAIYSFFLHELLGNTIQLMYFLCFL
jgi:hypothetical protein